MIIEIKTPSIEINNTAELWNALAKTIPSFLAFILSFIIILITWVNHHNSLKLINKSSPAFIYANGFLLLSVVFVPFPTSLIGEYLFTDHSSPAVILYNATLAIQAVAWILICSVALKNKLAKNVKSGTIIKTNKRFGYFAFIFYSVLAMLAIWYPLSIFIITTISWIFWLIYGFNIKHEEV